MPVSKSGSLTIGGASGCNDNRYDNETEEAGDLDRSGDDLRFTKPSYVREIDGENQRKTDRDNNGRRNVGPIANKYCGSGAFCSNGDGVAIAIAYSKRETDGWVNEATCKMWE